MLLVHLTEASPAELQMLRESFDAWFGLCPRSNLYIHGRLPDFSRFDFASGRICLATDSLASCPDLNLLEEAITAHRAARHLPLAGLLHAITQNPADFLGIGDRAGRFRAGMQPGVVHIQTEGERLEPGASAVLMADASFG
jgi:cytosine/adenosine deaminase-related metal-dependent hydrolase